MIQVGHLMLSTLEPLDDSTFTIGQVAKVLSITPAIIANHHHNNGLDYCSESPERGRGRDFCVIDVYMLALVREILELTGDANRAAEDVSRLVYFEGDRLLRSSGLLPPSRRKARKRVLRENLGAAHELFVQHRRPSLNVGRYGHCDGDWFLLREDADEAFFPHRYQPGGADYRRDEFSDALYRGVIARRRVCCVNATMRLRQVDEQLSSLGGGPKE
ncbi:MAG: hypothetical protein R3D51_19510 [Hyphomicrobiaceae bacterium]